MKIGDIRSNLLDLSRCHSCDVRESSLCSGMTDEEFSHINLSIEETYLPAGSFLFRQGNDGRHIFSIRQGMLNLTVSGKTVIIALCAFCVPAMWPVLKRL